MANGLTNAIRHQFAMMFVSIRGRSCVFANILLLSHCGEYPCECKKLIFAANSQKNDTIAQDNYSKSEALQMVTKACEFLTNPCEFLTKLTEFLVNPLRMLRILTNVLRSLRISCDAYQNVTKTTRMCEFWEHVPNIRNTTWTIANTYEHLRMSGDHFAIIAKWWRMAFVSPFAIYSPLSETNITFATPDERPRMLTNTYECLAIIANWWRIAFISPFAIYSPQCETSII